jgi:two-component system, NarL family, sensor kinase
MTAHRRDHRLRDLSSLGASLVGLLVVGQLIAVAGLVAWAITLIGGRAAGRPGATAIGIAAVVAVVSVRGTVVWICVGVGDLMSIADPADRVPLVRTSRAGGDEPVELLEALASTICDLLDVDGVEIEVWSTPVETTGANLWQPGAAAAVGRTSATGLERPLAHAGRTYGIVRVTLRRRTTLGGATRRRIDDLVGHAALVVSSAVLREELEASRERLVLAREEERRRVRRDLHDGLGPSLAAIKLQVATVRRRLVASHVSSPELDALPAMVTDATEEVRRVVEDLRPPLLDDCGLVDALRNLRFVPPTLRLSVEAPSTLPKLPAAIEVALYRIGAEAVRNTVRHAHASTCTVTISVDDASATLVACDDGSGIEVRPPIGVGTSAIAERAGELGGHVSIGPDPAGGTRVVAVLPLRPGSDA